VVEACTRRIDEVARVLSAELVESPISGPILGRRGAFIHVELLEDSGEGGDPRSLGEVIFGDLLTLELGADGGDVGRRTPMPLVEVVVRRAVLHFASLRPSPLPLGSVPAELAPMLARGRGGMLLYREHVVRQGDRLRLRAVVEPRGDRLAIRDDLSRVDLDEVLEFER
jgi:hypothetical protein